MTNMYESNYRKLLELCPELPNLKTGSYRFSEVAGFMKLNLDVLRRSGNVIVIALSHYYRHPSGDMVADPDMELEVNLDSGTAEALSYQDIMRYDVVYPEYPSKQAFRPGLRSSLNGFLKMWLVNCKCQGHRLTQKKQDK